MTTRADGPAGAGGADIVPTLEFVLALLASLAAGELLTSVDGQFTNRGPGQAPSRAASRLVVEGHRFHHWGIDGASIRPHPLAGLFDPGARRLIARRPWLRIDLTPCLVVASAVAQLRSSAEDGTPSRCVERKRIPQRRGIVSPASDHGGADNGRV